MGTFWCLLNIGVGLIICLHLTTEVDSQDVFLQDRTAEVHYTNSLCEPKCEPNQLCTALGICLPKCVEHCGEYGVCTGVFSCGCMEGYKWVNGSKCRPICSPKCESQATCTAPNNCVRNPEPEKINKSGICQPDCGENGLCGENNQCECQSGYVWNSKKHRCQPTCTPKCGDNSVCIEPDNCRCIDIGYNYVNGTCQSMCKNDCGEHGSCVGLDKCDCAVGYVWNRHLLKCMPKCDPICGLNSFCERPNGCKCHGGYIRNDPRSLSCSVPINWWMYLLIGIMVLTILCSVGGIIIYFVKRRSNVSYYPNSSFPDNTFFVS